MTLSISVVLALGVICALLLRAKKIKPAHLAVCALFGFYLSTTSLGPQVAAIGRTLAGLIQSLRF